MKRHGWLFVLVVVLSVTSGCAKDASKLDRTGSSRGWGSFPVPIYSGTNLASSSAAQADLQAAMSFWEGKAGRKLFDYRGTMSPSTAAYSGTPDAPGTITTNVIQFQNPWPFGPNVAGLTTVNWAGSQIEGAVVMINNTIPLCSGDCPSGNATSQRKAFAHELGHFLGLQHGSDVNDIMYPTLQPGGKLDTVSVDLTTLMELTSDVAQ